MAQQTLFSGIQPTGTPHIGNYFGALKQWVELQHDYDSLYCLVDLHALTTERDPGVLRTNTFESARDLLAIGLDPENATIFVQSHVPAHSELAWIFNTLTPITELERMTQYKDKAAENAKNINAGLLTYPTLMAADILLYNATVVPVGDDQMQHIELARIIARKFNNKYGEFFTEPEGKLTTARRIKSLSDPEKKMSKSHGEAHYIAITDDPDTITKKIRKAVTDTGADGEMTAGVQNLFDLLSYCGADDDHARLTKAFNENKLQYVELKDAVAENLIKILVPIQKKRSDIADDDVEKILHAGAQAAAERANKALQHVQDMIGLWK